MTAIAVRRATGADLDAICAITNREIETGFAHFGTELIGTEELQATFVRESGRYPWLVATDPAGSVIGFAKAGPWKSRGAYAWTAEIGVYIDAAARGRGVGRALYDALLPMLRDAGFRTIFAGVALPNEASVRLHEAVGMTRVGVFPSAGFKLGAWRDVGYWAIRFGEGPPRSKP